jgi:hypothetical protein
MWPNHRVPHGTPDKANEGQVKKISLQADQTPDLRACQKLQQPRADQSGYHCSLLTIWRIFDLKLICVDFIGCSVGLEGLAHRPRHWTKEPSI